MSSDKHFPLHVQHEIIKHYLEAVAPANRHDPYPYDELTRLMLVCNEWKSFVLGLKTFWKNVTITHSGAMGRAIMRSGDELLDVRGRLINVEEEENLSRLDLLLQYRARIRSLDLVTSRMVLAQWDADRYTEVSVLKNVILETTNGTHQDPETREEDLLGIFKTPTLRTVELKGFTDREANTLMTKRVEVLKLQGMRFTDRPYWTRGRYETHNSIMPCALASMKSLQRLYIDSRLFGENARYEEGVKLPSLNFLSLVIGTKELAKARPILYVRNLRGACVEILAPPDDAGWIMRSIGSLLDEIPWKTTMPVARLIVDELNILCITFMDGSREALKIRFHRIGELGTIFRLVRYNLSRCLERLESLCILMHNGQRAMKKLETEALVLMLSGTPGLRHLEVQIPMKPDDVLKPSPVKLPKLASIAAGITQAEDARFLTFLDAPLLQHANFEVSAMDEDVPSILESVTPHLNQIAENEPLPIAEFQLLGRTRHNVYITLGNGEGQLRGIDLEFKGIRAQAALLRSLATHVAPSFQLVEDLFIRKGDGYADGAEGAWYAIFKHMPKVRTLRVEGQGSKTLPLGLAYRDKGEEAYHPLFPRLESLTLESVWFRPPKKRGRSKTGRGFINDLLRSLKCRDDAEQINILTLRKVRKIYDSDIADLKALIKEVTRDK
ncbi:hypothetical protein GLOTRDRAFT_131680 [Gloeophyllum trabeum ATCC 11539]|uniref:F-box domain-containing protein n=1 Tax=Gloeophyllum trabeum (strain ATCC 11539 / FP-39264 / Madison 617) TaxID=670483 RepID=S7PY43_GLOTA|nr:uncharacterized protein GLOTRDRAFT_131680 [Gloeophyllum trabeum ATCC 11539]EPQ52438.1 hypothetical protein GLOTRDRAFT_131680 [Gloeophyllum trabeum ATCC 11539]